MTSSLTTRATYQFTDLQLHSYAAGRRAYLRLVRDLIVEKLRREGVVGRPTFYLRHEHKRAWFEMIGLVGRTLTKKEKRRWRSM
jgi:hypothetical protein